MRLSFLIAVSFSSFLSSLSSAEPAECLPRKTVVDETLAYRDSVVSWVTLPGDSDSGGPTLTAAFILWYAENVAN